MHFESDIEPFDWRALARHVVRSSDSMAEALARFALQDHIWRIRHGRTPDDRRQPPRQRRGARRRGLPLNREGILRDPGAYSVERRDAGEWVVEPPPSRVRALQRLDELEYDTFRIGPKIAEQADKALAAFFAEIVSATKRGGR